MRAGPTEPLQAPPPGWLGLAGPGARSRLSLPRYLALTGTGLALSAAQLFLLQRWLSARQFGLVVLAVSVTQGILQFGDLGLSRLCIARTRTPEEQHRLRAQGQALSLVTAAAVLAVAGGLMVPLASQRVVLAALALGALAGAAVSGEKFRAAAAEVAGDEVGAATRNFVWTNGPKLGLVAGLLAFRSAVPILVSSVALAALVASPYRAPARAAVDALRRWRVWAVPFVPIVAGFVLTWSDTYFLGARQGIDAAGSYEALYRVMGVCTYAFLPLVSVVSARVNAGHPRPLGRPLVLSLAATLATVSVAAWFVVGWGDDVFPNLDLPLDAIVPLVVLYLGTACAYCLGTALYARARIEGVVAAGAVSATLCLAGHAAFTLGGGPVTAASVAASAMAVNAAILGASYLSTLRRR